MGDKSLRNLENNLKKVSAGDQDVALKKEIQKMENKVENFQVELKKEFESLFEEEKKAMKNVTYGILLKWLLEQ